MDPLLRVFIVLSNLAVVLVTSETCDISKCCCVQSATVAKTDNTLSINALMSPSIPAMACPSSISLSCDIDESNTLCSGSSKGESFTLHREPSELLLESPCFMISEDGEINETLSSVSLSCSNGQSCAQWMGTFDTTGALK